MSKIKFYVCFLLAELVAATILVSRVIIPKGFHDQATVAAVFCIVLLLAFAYLAIYSLYEEAVLQKALKVAGDSYEPFSFDFFDRWSDSLLEDHWPTDFGGYLISLKSLCYKIWQLSECSSESRELRVKAYEVFCLAEDDASSFDQFFFLYIIMDGISPIQSNIALNGCVVLAKSKEQALMVINTSTKGSAEWRSKVERLAKHLI